MRATSCLVLLTLGCTYDPPPEVALPLPSDGIFLVGSPLTLTFTEAVDPGTLAIRVWSAAPEDRTIEHEHRPGLLPEVDLCRPRLSDAASEPPNCADGSTFTLSVDRKSAELHLGGPKFGRAKVPWQLEVSSGLADDAGRPTGAPTYFDFQFSPSGTCSGDLVNFTDGVYLLVAPVTEPVATTLQMYFDVHTLPTGEFAWAGAKAKYTGDDKGTADPEQLTLDTTARGFAVFPVGCLRPDGDDRFLSSEPFDIFIDLAGILITMKEVRIAGAVVPDPGTGEERIEGTISFGSLILNFGEPFTYPAGNAPFAMRRLTAATTPAGIPRLCGDLCGAVTAQCTPGASIPDPAFCADLPDESPRRGGTDGTDTTDSTDGTDSTGATDGTGTTDSTGATDGTGTTDGTTDGTGATDGTDAAGGT